MRTPASIHGHPFHVMLVGIPIGLWVFSFACDLFYVFSPDTTLAWRTVALYCMAGGVVAALAAAVPGVIDLLSLPKEFAKTGMIHAAINLVVVGIYAANLFFRWNTIDSEPPPTGPVWLSGITIVMLLVSGWLGGRMVHEMRVGVVEPGEMPAHRRTKSRSSTGHTPGRINPA